MSAAKNTSINDTDLNEQQIIGSIIDPESNSSQDFSLMINDEVTNFLINSGNESIQKMIMPAMPGIPIFLKPPDIKIHDPDEGPLDPYHHPTNDTQVESNWPSSIKLGQKYIYVKRPKFVAEKGSLEEKYKHLLTDDDDNSDEYENPSDGIITIGQNSVNPSTERVLQMTTTHASVNVLTFINRSINNGKVINSKQVAPLFSNYFFGFPYFGAFLYPPLMPNLFPNNNNVHQYQYIPGFYHKNNYGN